MISDINLLFPDEGSYWWKCDNKTVLLFHQLKLSSAVYKFSHPKDTNIIILQPKTLKF
jgi:Leu/Phe-tRNA-protein transferase